MAKTLIVKGANYETNALEQVVIEVIECTGISLNKDTLSIVTTGNTETLIATKTPADTTQPVVWSTSDSNVVTVSNGIVTAVGVGSATVTVTCGNYSASATVNVTEFMDKTILKKISGIYVNATNALSESGNGLTTVQRGSTYQNRGTLAAGAGDLVAGYVDSSGTEPFYAYPIPHNAKRVKVTDTGSSAIKKQTICWYNLNTPVSLSGYENWCAVLGATAIQSDSSNTVIVDIPVYSGFSEVDGMIIMFRTYKSGTTFVDTDFDEVSIEFLPAAN